MTDPVRDSEDLLDLRIRAETEAAWVLMEEGSLKLAFQADARRATLIASRSPEHVERLEREKGLA